MYTKTTAVASLAAISGVMANAGNAPSNGIGYAYPANHTVPTPVWQYYNTTVPTTVVVPELTTVCPEATTMSFNGVHYSATKGQTVTVTNCPCTVTKAVHTMTSSLCPPGVTPTAVAPGVPGAPNGAPNGAPPAGYPVGSPAGSPAPPAGSVPIPPGAAPAVPAAPGSPSPASPNSPMASGSGVYPSQPTGVQIAGAARTGSGVAAALFAAFVGVLAL